MPLRARLATPEEDARWDDLVASLGRPHVLQSRGWAEVKRPGGWDARRVVVEQDRTVVGAAQVLLKEIALAQRYAYAPRGPLVRDPSLVADVAAAVAHAIAPARAAALLFDPELEADPALERSLRRAGCLPGRFPVQPRRTLVLDIAREPDALLAEMRKKTRQYIRKGERDGVTTEESDDIRGFYEIQQAVAKRVGFGIHERSYFDTLWRVFAPQGRAHLFFASVAGTRVAAVLLLRWGETAWEMFGGPTGEHAETRPFYLLKWRAMLRLRQLGVRSYDMWGLAESARDDDPLAGVENFKTGFGGEQRSYVGAWEAPTRDALFLLWRFASRVLPAAT
jgi:lipid II:glycine glycyltransferase (peptidoglycan interpeptide bridge formation enzyme)